MKFVKKRKPGQCGVRHRPVRPDAGHGLCTECEEIVAREGISVPDHIRATPAATKPVAATAAVKAPATAEDAAIPSKLPPAAHAFISTAVKQQKDKALVLAGILSCIPATQEGYEDMEMGLRVAHQIEKNLLAFLEHYRAPLQALDAEYQTLIRPGISLARSVKEKYKEAMQEALQRAKEGVATALSQIEEAAAQGVQIPDSAITAAAGITASGPTRTHRSWKLLCTSTQFIENHPEMAVIDKAAMDKLAKTLSTEAFNLRFSGVAVIEETEKVIARS